MTGSRAHSAVILGLVVSGGAVVVAGATRGQLPRPRQLLAIGVLFVAIAAVADTRPRLAGPLAGLVTTGVVLAQGEDAARGALRAVTSRAPLGAKPVPSTAPPAATAAAPAAGAGGPGGALADAVPAAGGHSPPLAGSGHAVIGTPGAGTHSFTAPPNNWESDNAVDIAAPVGTPVLAVRAGLVGQQIGSLGSSDPRMAGLRVHLDASSGESFYYAHLSRLTVRAGQRVPAGALLGYSGSANGVAHLHFAVNPPHDPRSYLS